MELENNNAIKQAAYILLVILLQVKNHMKDNQKLSTK